MAISYTQNGIIFDNINYGEGALPSKYGNANNGDFFIGAVHRYTTICKRSRDRLERRTSRWKNIKHYW